MERGRLGEGRRQTHRSINRFVALHIPILTEAVMRLAEGYAGEAAC